MESLFVIVSAFVALGGFVSWVGVRELWKLRTLRRTPVSRIVDLREGVVKLHGMARPAGETLTAPFSGVPCLAYDFQVERWVKGRKGDSSWHTVASERRVLPFELDDGTGRVRVDAEGAEMSIAATRDFTYTGEPEADAYEERCRREAASDPAAGLPEWVDWLLRGGPERFRYYEECLLPDKDVFVLGLASAPAGGPMTVGKGSPAPFFVISNRPESHLWFGAALKGGFLALFGGLFVFAGLYVYLVQM